jgi:hypothetical protein
MGCPCALRHRAASVPEPTVSCEVFAAAASLQARRARSARLSHCSLALPFPFRSSLPSSPSFSVVVPAALASRLWTGRVPSGAGQRQADGGNASERTGGGDQGGGNDARHSSSKGRPQRFIRLCRLPAVTRRSGSLQQLAAEEQWAEAHRSGAVVVVGDTISLPASVCLNRAFF